MKTVKEFLTEEQLDEKLITFGGKAFPKFGQIVIMSGGAGSGKGFIKDKLIGIEGWNFDVDALKLLAVKTPIIIKKIKNELGVDLSKLDPSKKGQEKVLKDSENVGKLHDIIGSYLSLDDKKLTALYTSIMTSHPDRKPNIIFDVTLKDLQKLANITRQASRLGYDKKNIHVVWIVNDIEVAKEQNIKRARTVPTEILINTHRGASQTMHDIIDMGKNLTKYMDGDIVFAFNKIGVDIDLKTSEAKPSKVFKSKGTEGGSYIKDAEYFYIKRSGKQVTSITKINKDIRAKISKYVPKNVEW